MPTTKKTPKKTKRDWRKNVNISQEEAALEKERAEKIAERESSVFFVDKVKTPKKKLTKEEAREWKTVRERLLEPQSKVPPFGVGPVTPKRIGSEAARINKVAEKLRKSGGSTADQLQISTSNRTPKKPYDLWSEGPKNVLPRTKQQALAPRPVPTARATPLPHAIAQAVDIVPPGASYRPAPEDLQQLKRKARLEDRARTEKEMKLNRQLSYPKSLDRVSKRMKTDDELSFSESEKEETKEEANSDDNEAQEISRHYMIKLTDKDRRKLRREKRAAARHKKKEDKPEESFEKKLKEAVKEARVLEKKQKQQERAGTKAVPDRPKLGSKHFVDVPTSAIVQQPAGALRAQNQKINPVTERFLSVQRRGLIEKRDPTKKRRRYALKSIVKRSALTPAV